MKKFEIYSVGMCYMSVCSSLSTKEIVERANLEHPTNIRFGWKMAKNKKFRTGQTNPCLCDKSLNTHKHYLLSC